MNESANDSQPAERERAGAPSFIVGVGASAGGLQALEELFRAVPPVPQLAFVVIQHLSPDYKSMMAELLTKHTRLPVRRAENGAVIRGGEVWVIPPKKNLTVAGGRLILTDQPETRTFNLPIDMFLRSLAAEYEERAIAVVLSGTGSDGTLGIREVKGAGGLVMVQDPSSATFDGMPKSAMATRVVDYVDTPAMLARRLVAYATTSSPSVPEDLIVTAPDAMANILNALHDHSGVDFTSYRSGTLLRRITKRMQMCQLADVSRYADYLLTSRQEVAALYLDLLIGVTSFFRNREAFEALRTHVIPALCADLPLRSTVRVWSAGCSTGEEPYSMAALFLNEFDRRERPDLDVKVFATDVDPESLSIAATGVYPMSTVVDIPPELLARSFVKDGDHYRVTQALRRAVIFSRHNVTRDPPFNRMDLVSCRNLLIYFKPEVQQRVLEIFRFALKPNGSLFLGHSESLGSDAPHYRVVDSRWKLFRKETDAPRPILQNLLVPSRSEARVGPLEFKSARTQRAGRREQRVFRKVMSRYAPPSVIVDNQLRVLFTFGAVNDFLEIPVGELDNDLLRLALPELSAVLSTVSHRVTSTRERVVYRGVSVTDDDGVARRIDVVAEPIEERGDDNLFIILFNTRDERTPADSQALLEDVDDGGESSIRYDTSQHLADLKTELQYTKETLQATIEELETSNEELQATNEELLASNEELQSTNEELQSVNEELVTVNTEYQEKIRELTEVNNDIENLMSNTRFGIIFLDRAMRVRRFTPACKRVVNLLPSDVGRELSDLSFRTDPDQFLDSARQVLETLVPVERPAIGEDGSRYLVSIVPYRTRDDIIQGVVMVFIDTTEQQRLSGELRRANAELRALRSDGSSISPPPPLRIALVEDDMDDANQIQRAFAREKVRCDVRHYRTLEEARSELKPGTDTDLVLLDINLPDGTGLELLEELKSDEATRAIPVVVLSGLAEEEHVQSAYAQHAACVLSKALGFAELSLIVQSVTDFWLTVVRLPPPRAKSD